ncbi:MAG: 7-carboxy-7-deazaguanine synthase QueE [Pseudomonadota bacterium]
MFGQNPIRKQVVDNGEKLWVQEVFPTLQGEGPFVGWPSVFVRLAGCNLRCYFCDTEFESSQWHPTLDELLENIEQHLQSLPHCRLIVLTGGEPFRQNITPLVNRLLASNKLVQIETAGTLGLDHFPYTHNNLHIVCSPKTPQVDVSMRYANAWKYVINGDIDLTDGLPLNSTQIAGKKSRIARPTNDAPVYVMPCDEKNAQKNAAHQKSATDIAMRYGYRLCLQLHKIVDIP